MDGKLLKVSNSKISTAEYLVWKRVGYSDSFGFKVKLNFSPTFERSQILIPHLRSQRDNFVARNSYQCRRMKILTH